MDTQREPNRPTAPSSDLRSGLEPAVHARISGRRSGRSESPRAANCASGEPFLAGTSAPCEPAHECGGIERFPVPHMFSA